MRGIQVVAVYGGASYRQQIRDLKRGVQIVGGKHPEADRPYRTQSN